MLGQNIGRVGLPDMSSGGRPSLTLDFVGIPVLNERITFSRTSGATWFSPDGVLEGVDFSTSSVAIGTGSKTFTLAATAGANRYWSVGDLVRVSQQSNSANFMEGTVTSYTASTQVLVIDVTSTGGSGTIASWRVSSHMPRFDFNPTTLAAQGLLIEEQRTNSVANNTATGTVAGTPGTAPTGWAISGSANNLTRTIVGTGVENGIAYIDVQYTTGGGTTAASGSFNILPITTTAVAAASGQTWTGSTYVKLQAGSLTNLTNVTTVLVGRDSGGTLLENTSLIIAPTNAALNTQRYVVSRTLNNASTVFVTVTSFQANYASGVSIDVTLRIGLPQLEQGAFATSVIPTTTMALTRSADVASVNTLSPWFNATEGTLFAEAVFGALDNFKQVANFNNATSSELLALQTGTAPASRASVVDGGIGQATLSPGNLTANTGFKISLAYKENDFAAVLNGGTVQTDAAGTLPTVTQMNLGGLSAASGVSLIWLRRVTYYPRRLSNAELVSITT